MAALSPAQANQASLWLAAFLVVLLALSLAGVITTPPPDDTPPAQGPAPRRTCRSPEASRPHPRCRAASLASPGQPTRRPGRQRCRITAGTARARSGRRGRPPARRGDRCPSRPQCHRGCSTAGRSSKPARGGPGAARTTTPPRSPRPGARMPCRSASGSSAGTRQPGRDHRARPGKRPGLRAGPHFPGPCAAGLPAADRNPHPNHESR